MKVIHKKQMKIGEVKSNNGSQDPVCQTNLATTIAIEKNNNKKTDDYIFSKKNFALEYIQNNTDKQLYLFSQDLGNKGAKNFVCVTRDEMYNMCTTQKSPHYYENIEANIPVKFHIDIDKKIGQTNRAILDHAFNELIEEVIQLFNTEFKKYNVDMPEIIILKSDHVRVEENVTKISAHIIYKNVIFNDINDMKIFILKMKSDSQLFENNVIDKNIYRVGCFRMMYCSKSGKTNKLRCYRDRNYKFADEKTHFMDSLVTHITGNDHHIIQIEYQTDTKIKTEKIRQIMKQRAPVNDIFFYSFGDTELAELTKVTSNINRKFTDNYNYWILMTYSFIDLYNHIDKKYQKAVYNVWDDICKKSKSYNKANNKRYFFSLQLDYIDANFILCITYAPFRFKKVIRFNHIKPKFNNYKIDKLNSRFINDDLYKKVEMYDIIALKSPPGTGKTTFLNNVLDVYEENGKNVNRCKYPIISITSRKNLAEKHAKDFGIFDYSSVNNYLFDIDNIAVTVNSLLRISESNFENCYLVLDETSKILEYLKSDLLSGIRYIVYNMFCNIIKSARKILLLDADLNETDIDTIVSIKKLAKNDASCYLGINEFKSKAGINAYFYDNPRTVAELLINDFKKGIPFMCAFDSLTKMKQLLEEIKKTAIEMNIIGKIDDLIRVYSSEEINNIFDPDDLNSRLCYFFSPIVIFGLDANSTVPRKVYSFAFKKILTPYEVNQQIQRERNHSEVHIYVNQKIGKLRYMSRDELEKDIIERVEKYNDVVKEIKEVLGIGAILNVSKNENVAKIFSDMYISTSFIYDTVKVDMEYYLKNIMMDMGYKIVDKKDNKNVNNFEFETKKQEPKMDFFDKLFLNDDLNSKKKDIILKRMEIMRIKPEQLDDFNKGIILSESKFSDYMNLRKFMKVDLEKSIIVKDSIEMAEHAAESVYIKLREYKYITSILRIKNGLQFNYDKDNKKFKGKITDKYILDNIDRICNMFRLTGAKNNKFDEAGGYEKLYNIAISMCRHLFGNKIVTAIFLDKKVSGKALKIPMYNLNSVYMNNISKYMY